MNAVTATATDNAVQLAFPSRISVADCFQKVPQAYDFVLPGFLAGTVGLLTSPGGAGKSMLAMQLAASIATGTSKLGIGIEREGNVLFLAGEDPQIALHHRLHDLGKMHSGDERKQIAARCDFRCTIGLGTDLMADRWCDWIAEQSKGQRLVIIDTLRRFHSLDENDAADATEIMSRLERIAHQTNAAILVLHHVNKSSVTNGQSDSQQAARGSGVFIDNSRWASFLAVMTEREADDRGIGRANRRRYVRWNINKQNYGAPIHDAWLERGAGGILIPTDFVTVEQKAGAHSRASNGGSSNEKWY